jgi:hypothetical protein
MNRIPLSLLGSELIATDLAGTARTHDFDALPSPVDTLARGVVVRNATPWRRCVGTRRLRRQNYGCFGGTGQGVTPHRRAEDHWCTPDKIAKIDKITGETCRRMSPTPPREPTPAPRALDGLRSIARLTGSVVVSPSPAQIKNCRRPPAL